MDIMTYNERIKKFFIAGVSAAAVNFMVISIFIEILGFRMYFLKNLANILAIEISALYNFLISRVWTWKDSPKRQGKSLVAQFLSYNIARSLIAAHPYLADNIPLFAQRKVFINDELSLPFFDNYWQVIKKRTYDFFDAYYSDDARSLYDFCHNNGIAYWVVDASHFTGAYLGNRQVYFEPFNQYALDVAASRKGFVLDRIRGKDKLFTKGMLFVINEDVLLRY
jgi:putative flippase GtrA